MPVVLALMAWDAAFGTQSVPITDGGFTKQADYSGSFVAPVTGFVRLGNGYEWKVSEYQVTEGDTVQCDVYATGLFAYGFGDIPAGTPCSCYMLGAAVPPAPAASSVDEQQVEAINALLPLVLTASAVIWGVKRLHKLLDSGRSEE